jgi:uncharacterized protein
MAHVGVAPQGTPPAGWYADPFTRGRLRYWDGRGWTQHVAVRSVKPPRPPHSHLPLRAAVEVLVVLAASLIGSRLLLEWLSHYRWPIAAYILIGGALGYGPVLVWCWRSRRRWGGGSLRGNTGLFARWADTGWGPIVWLCCIAANAATVTVILLTDIPFTSNLEGTDELPGERGYVISLLVLAVVAAPLVEEMVFRGVMMRGFLSVMGPVATVALQAVLFGCAHYDPIRGRGNIGLIIVLSGVGAVLGGAAYLFRRIGPPIIAHAIMNAIAMTIALSGWDPG